MKPPMRSVLIAVFLVSLVIPILRAQVSNDRLLRSADEPRNWMMYSGTYASQRYSTLSQINPSNVKNLEQKWIFQAESLEKFETTPLVVDGIMYISQAPSDASLSMQKPAASFGSTATIPRRTQDRAADPSIAAWRSWVTHCFWRPSMRTLSHWTRRPAGPSGIPGLRMQAQDML